VTCSVVHITTATSPNLSENGDSLRVRFLDPEGSPVHHNRLLSVTLVVATITGLATTGAAAATAPSVRSAPTATHRTVDTTVCKHTRNSRSRCFAIRVDRVAHGRVRHESTPLGYGARDLESAYSLPAASAGHGETVAVVDAYDDPSAAADLAVYRQHYGLPACTTSNRCFRKVDENAGTDYPAPDSGWAEEESLDLDMVSAACPNCHLLLVEATTTSMTNLGKAVDTAAALGADAISNSYGGPDASDRSYGRFYHHPGIAVTASAGDNGYGASYPASSKWVSAVGGTSLSRSSGARGFTETAWSDGGSGCSTLNTAPWQSEVITGCAGRAVADVSAVADPATGVAVYDSDSDEGAAGWLEFGGTSASAPLVAGIFALGGATSSVVDGSFLWDHHTGLHDVTSGANGTCAIPQWCRARTGWDGPTGWGTPDGVAAFAG